MLFVVFVLINSENLDVVNGIKDLRSFALN